MLSTPSFPRGRARVDWQPDPNGGIRYRIRGASEGGLAFNAGMLVIAMMADGERNLGEIYDAVLENGIGIDDPAHVVLVFRRLEQLGVIAMDWHYETTGPIRHRCTGCGTSCEGHLISPLTSAERERVVRLKEQLKALEPDLPDAAALMEVEDDGGNPTPALHVLDGRCVFLATDGLCAIHRHFGPEAKPLQCRLFPLRVINTEDGFRVGISGRCTMAHRSFRDAEPQTPEQAIAGILESRPPGDIVGLDPARPKSLSYTAAYEAQLGMEGYFLALSERAETPLAGLVCGSAGVHRPDDVPPVAYLRDVVARLRRFADRVEPSPLNRPGTGYGDRSRALLADLAALDTATVEWNEPPSIVGDFIRHTLHQFVFLRNTAAYPTVEVAFHTALVGMIGALLTCEQATDEGGEGVSTVSDVLGGRVAVWLRLINVAASHQFLFDGREDFELYAAPLRALGGH